MFKSLLTLTALILMAGSALCKSADTAVMFFDEGGRPVHSITQATYYMLILPPNVNDTRYNIQEFYKSGALKLVGKADGQGNVMRTGAVLLDGDCVSYFQTGKKSSIIHYNKGYKEGIEEMYYPDGSLWCRIKHSGGIYSKTFYLDCYDPKGAKICDAGNGKWLVYNDSCAYVKEEGVVKNGKKEGDWKGGFPFMNDTIKYVYHYKHSLVNGSESYDKKGKSYPFIYESEKADYRSGGVTFLEVLRSHIKVPKDPAGVKMNADTSHILFVVEKDGSITHADILGVVDPQLKEAILAGLAKCNRWSPIRFYGVPFRTQIIFPLKEVTKYYDKFSETEVMWQEHVLKDDE